ncbi:cell division protein FtsK [Phycicoccus sp. HDW14]|uniref:FtsK/SpoIIIE domain-containing protein n=1 Tax=Phycicoccus sp. HDW14 TaxID=2714941 RepID=UPI00140D9F0F|nr:FtsK/SpoIIIE domain-containing protein [Phycicoccus sp. HDW14]QIM22006.1 cell division protein FtsK [Phycicoccus sp. HDW14]
MVGIVVVTGLMLWCQVAPASYGRLAAPRLALLWKSPMYRLRWSRVASRCGLVVHPHGVVLHDEPTRVRIPTILRVTVSPTGLERLLLRLPVGLTPDDVASRAEAVGHAFHVADARVVLARPGRVWLELRRRDPLEGVLHPITPGPVALRGVPLGMGDDGKPWRFRVEGTHALVAGATGAGKGSVLWSLVHGLSPAIREGWVQVWAIDPKGGMELGLGRGAFARFEGGHPDAMCVLLEEAVDLKTRRSLELSTHGLRVHRPSVDSPHLVVVIDELATLSAFAERTVVRRIEHALGLLLTQGRAVGITVIAAVQDPGKDVVSWRDLFPTRIAMRLDNPIQVDMVLGDGARERGARADHISELTPGVAYVRTEGTRDVRRVRSTYLTDADILNLSTSLAPRPTSEHSRDEHDEGEAA